jgi:hypothetical protein
MENNNRHEDRDVFEDPVFTEMFLPLYRSYKMLDRNFDRKVIDKDIENLRKRFDAIALSKEHRKPRS